jgi:hypothetical protein
MKATLEFNFEDADDVTRHLRCIKATDMAFTLWQIIGIRGKLEHLEEHKKLTSEEVMSMIAEIFDDNGINIDELLT